VIELMPQVFTVPWIELKVTDPATDPKPVPEIVSVVPVTAEPGETPEMTGVGVNATPLLA
jgi:hypothetical protein